MTETRGIGLKGDGGYILAPGSANLNGPYEFIKDTPRSAPLPPNLIENLPFCRDKAAPTARKSARVEVEIPGGSRNIRLTSDVGKLVNMGYRGEKLFQAVLLRNGDCVPPLGESEVRAICESAERNFEQRDFERITDVTNAERLALRHGETIRYVKGDPRGYWLSWNGVYWKSGEPVEKAKDTVAQLIREVANCDVGTADQIKQRQQRIAKAQGSESAFRVAGMLQMARTIPTVEIELAVLDASKFLLNVENGTVDLKSGNLLPARKEDYITRVAPVRYSADAKCPRFDEFLSTIFGGDAETIRFVWRSMGLALTGDTGEQGFWIAHGQGANGKSTFLDVMHGLLGDGYACSTSVETVMENHKRQSGSAAAPDLVRLRGKRFVTAVEGSAGAKLNEQRLKILTGGDQLPARGLYKDQGEFTPELKFWYATNHLPKIVGTDLAMWRRIWLVPFTVTIPAEKRIKSFKSILLEEREGILQGAIAGCLEWQKEGLRPPESVMAATEAYRKDQDALAPFLTDFCEIKDGWQVEAKILSEAYLIHCKEEDVLPLAGKEFAARLREKGLSKRKSNGVPFWYGIRLKEDVDNIIAKARRQSYELA